jgi:hypothetical protein
MLDKIMEVADHLTFNKDDLISIYKNKFRFQLENFKTYTGFKKQMFREHLEQSIKQDVREMLSSKFNLNAEQAMYIETDEVVNPIISNIIEGSLS